MRPLAVDSRAIYDDLAALYVPVAVAAFAIVVVALVWAVARRGRDGRDEHNTGELLIASGLGVVAAVLLAATFRANDKESARASGPAEVIDVTAAKWGWRFNYPRRGISVGDARSPALLTVPAGADVEFRATSEDVIHAFWVPDLKFQRQLIPRQTVTFQLRFPRPGLMRNGACSFYCGLEHAQMRFAIDVLAPDDYARWAAAR